MYKRINKKKLGRKKSHRESLVRNLLRSLFTSAKVETTTPKAKVLKSKAEDILNTVRNSKEEDLSLRRKLQEIFGNTDLAKKVYEICKKDGVKISIAKIGFRAGDNGEVSRVEIKGVELKKKVKKETKVKEEEVEKREAKVDVKKGIEKLTGKKVVKEKVANVSKERSRTRSGL